MLKPWVIKAGGELMASDQTRAKILNDLRAWHARHPVVFVHGGGPQIEAELIRQKVPIEFSDGRRVTTNETMVVVERVLSGQVNQSIVGELWSKKVKAVGLSGRDGGVMVGEATPKLGRAGRPVAVRTELLTVLFQKRFLPVLSSVASDKRGQALNINADDFAGALAVALKAGNLIYLTDVAGVQDKYHKRIPVLKIKDIDGLIHDETIQGGMIPKVQSARSAILKGVGEINIVDGTQGIDLTAGTKICK